MDTENVFLSRIKKAMSEKTEKTLDLMKNNGKPNWLFLSACIYISVFRLVGVILAVLSYHLEFPIMRRVFSISEYVHHRKANVACTGYFAMTCLLAMYVFRYRLDIMLKLSTKATLCYVNYALSLWVSVILVVCLYLARYRQSYFIVLFYVYLYLEKISFLISFKIISRYYNSKNNFKTQQGIISYLVRCIMLMILVVTTVIQLPLCIYRVSYSIKGPALYHEEFPTVQAILVVIEWIELYMFIVQFLIYTREFHIVIFSEYYLKKPSLPKILELPKKPTDITDDKNTKTVKSEEETMEKKVEQSSPNTEIIAVDIADTVHVKPTDNLDATEEPIEDNNKSAVEELQTVVDEEIAKIPPFVLSSDTDNENSGQTEEKIEFPSVVELPTPNDDIGVDHKLKKEEVLHEQVSTESEKLTSKSVAPSIKENDAMEFLIPRSAFRTREPTEEEINSMSFVRYISNITPLEDKYMELSALSLTEEDQTANSPPQQKIAIMTLNQDIVEQVEVSEDKKA